MGIIASLRNRRSYYALTKDLPVSKREVIETIKTVTELVPDAFNMKSARVAVFFGAQHDLFWNKVFSAFGGKVPKEKIASFKAGAGTILFMYDEETVQEMQHKFERYTENFPVWANQANGMLQLAVWSALRELDIGASLQHYNPVIDNEVKRQFHVPDQYRIVAQMPFGGIAEEPATKEWEYIDHRVRVLG